MAAFFSTLMGTIIKAAFLVCVAIAGIAVGKKLRDRKDAKEEKETM